MAGHAVRKIISNKVVWCCRGIKNTHSAFYPLIIVMFYAVELPQDRLVPVTMYVTTTKNSCSLNFFFFFQLLCRETSLGLKHRQKLYWLLGRVDNGVSFIKCEIIVSLCHQKCHHINDYFFASNFFYLFIINLNSCGTSTVQVPTNAFIIQLWSEVYIRKYECHHGHEGQCNIGLSIASLRCSFCVAEWLYNIHL